MHAFLRACRYFMVVAVVPRLFAVGFLVVLGVNALGVVLAPVSAAESLSPLLTLQMFAAASGFDLPARRGHYDLLLTSGVPRMHVALAHAAMSVLPGLLAWGVMEGWLSWNAVPGAATSGTVAAFLSVSATAWATAVPTSRAKASVGWVVLMTGPRAAGAVLPTTLIGRRLAWGPGDGSGVAAGLWVLLATVGAALALRHLLRTGVPLEASQ